MDKEKQFFYFVKNDDVYIRNSMFLCTINSTVSTKNELFSALDDGLGFDVFGWNWDALADSLCSLENIKQKRIIIFHKRLYLDDNTLMMYISCLLDAVILWRKYPHKHIMSPLFMFDDKKRVRAIVKNLLK